MAKHKILSHEETMELITEAQSGSKEAVDRLVEHNTRLIWGIVQRFTKRGHEPEDLFQMGVIGFLKSIDKFDMSFGVKFLTYCVPMVQGEIQRFVRDNGIVRIPRPVRDLAYKIGNNKLNNSTPEHISKVLEEPNIKLIKDTIQYIKQGTVKSIDEVVYRSKEGNENITLADQLSGDINGDDWFNHVALRAAVATLSVREREIIDLRYFRGLTQGEVSHILEVSQAHVSRLERKVLEKMKQLMKEEDNVSKQVNGNREKAIELLKNTELTYKEIAEKTGVPFGTVAKLGKDNRPYEIIQAIKKKAAKKRRKTMDKKEQPIETPIINDPAFGPLSDEEAAKRDKKFAASQHVFIDGDDIVVATPVTGAEAWRVKDTTAKLPTFTLKGVKPGIPVPATASQPVFVSDGTRTGRFQTDKPNISNVPKSEVVEQPQPQPEDNTPVLLFNFNVEAAGRNVTKEQVLESLKQAAMMVEQSPSETVTFQVKISN